MSEGSSSNSLRWSGNLSNAWTIPLIVLRVVSLPPTISSTRLPMNSSGLIWFIAGEWIIIEMRSPVGSECARSIHNCMKYAPISLRIAWRWTSRSRTRPISVSPAQSDQNVSSRRSSHGKSNSSASMPVVSSIETVSTQSNTWRRGSVSSSSPVRARISASMSPMFDGVNLGATVRRWPVCLGRSIAMNIGSSNRSRLRSASSSSLSRSRMVIPPSEE
jgi:hypothetical protein